MSIARVGSAGELGISSGELTLTDPTAKAAYDTDLGIATTTTAKPVPNPNMVEPAYHAEKSEVIGYAIKSCAKNCEAIMANRPKRVITARVSAKVNPASSAPIT